MDHRDLTQSLPPEVLSNIFQFCLPEEAVDLQRSISITDAPLLLTHVSSRWRAIAQSTHTLWNHITLKFEDDAGDEYFESTRYPYYRGNTHRRPQPDRARLIRQDLVSNELMRLFVQRSGNLPRFVKYLCLFEGRRQFLTEDILINAESWEPLRFKDAYSQIITLCARAFAKIDDGLKTLIVFIHDLNDTVAVRFDKVSRMEHFALQPGVMGSRLARCPSRPLGEIEVDRVGLPLDAWIFQSPTSGEARIAIVSGPRWLELDVERAFHSLFSTATIHIWHGKLSQDIDWYQVAFFLCRVTLSEWEFYWPVSGDESDVEDPWTIDDIGATDYIPAYFQAKVTVDDFLGRSESSLEEVIVRVYGEQLSEEDVVTVLSSCGMLSDFLSSADQITSHTRPEVLPVGNDADSQAGAICPILQEITFSVQSESDSASSDREL